VAGKKTQSRSRRKAGSHAEPAVAEAHGQIAQARASSETGLAAAVTRAVPDLEVEVTSETTISHEGKSYGPGDRFTLSGPDAISLIQGGYALPAGAK
jgi:hypothetical protein